MVMQKTDLLNLILEKYKENRSKFDYLMSNKKEIDLILSEGSKKLRSLLNK